MLIDCVYKQGEMCLAVNEKIENVKKIYGWWCKSDTPCGWVMPGATDKDRDNLLLERYRVIKRYKPDEALYWSQLAGHDACSDDDLSTIEYEAGMLALFMNKEWKYLLDDDFCCAAKQAKRLGLKLPTNTNKAYRRRKRRMCNDLCNI